MELLRPLIGENIVCAYIRADSKEEFMREMGRHFDALSPRKPDLIKVVFHINKEEIG